MRNLKWLIRSLGFVLLLTTLGGVAQAQGPPAGTGPPNGIGPPGQVKKNSQDVPEIDPGAITGALALLSGGLLLITDRARRK